MAAEPDGERTGDRLRKHDAQEGASRVGLPLAALGTESMEIEGTALGSANGDTLQLLDLHSVRIQAAASEQAKNLA